MARVVVVGAGVGGLAAAARLAAQGHRVVLHERAATHGGKLGEFRRDGFTFDTGPSLLTMPQVFTDLAEPSTKTETSTFSYTLPVTLVQGTTYYWKVVGKTMALKTKTSAVWTFTTEGVAPPPPPTGSAEIVLYASKATRQGSAWQVEPDSTAAGGAKIRNPNVATAISE